MSYTVKLYSEFENEIEKFLSLYFNENFKLDNKFLWKKEFESPIDTIDIMAVFADNKEKFKANMWISLDKDVFISISENNINSLIKYIYERFPY